HGLVEGRRDGEASRTGRPPALDFSEARGIPCGDMRAPRQLAHRALINVLLTLWPWPLLAPVWAAQPERPRASVDTRDVRPTGRTIAVAAGGNVQTALDTAHPGDVITLEAGARRVRVQPDGVGLGKRDARGHAAARHHRRSLLPPRRSGSG